MTARNMMLLAAFGSLALLLGAFVFQALGFAPCQMCLWQRWPHAVAVGVGAGVLLAGPLVLLGLAGALAAAVTGAIGVFHTGVEQGWWQGPTSCSGGGDTLQGLSGSDLLSLDAPANVVMCDEVAWADPVIGLSMATWNAVISFGLAAIWIAALRLRKANQPPQ